MKKTINFFAPRPELGYVTHLTHASSQSMRNWVGGRIILRPEFVCIEQNRLNRMVNSGTPAFMFSYREITGITLEPGLLTRIVRLDLAGEGGSVWVRSFGAEKLAAAISAQRVSLGQDPTDGANVTAPTS
ncbi:hypothetical protein [Lysinibacter cavernae]|uniref:GRAM domain-containing protein n=1 Tax=Lysinibacter cavernae TaxID=1640652 RepID=A0A7X5TUP6_9MICO|nr:hypothetical protein [Lysinibacter cavernae]NIH53797.1 hypothetical protein [Lysinibacter cavernae]